MALGLALVVHLVIGVVTVRRPGYSPDEEITATVVSAISEHGAPVLPSGVFYSRGWPYLYTAWGAAQIFGESLTTYRATSLAAALAGVVLMSWVGSRLGGPVTGALAAFLLAIFPPYLAAAAFARPYSALVACSLGALAIFVRWSQSPAPGLAWLFAGTVALGAALHPLGFVLLLIPMACVLTGTAVQTASTAAFGRLIGVTLVVTGGFQLPHAIHWRSVLASDTDTTASTAIYALPSAVYPPAWDVVVAVGPPGWAGTMLVFAICAFALARHRDGPNRWFIAVAAGLAAACQLGTLIILLTVSLLLWPNGSRFRAGAAAALGSLAVVWWAVLSAWQNDSLFSAASLWAMWRLATWYPLAALQYTAEQVPALATVAVVGMAAACFQQSPGALIVRASAVLVVVTLALFSAAGVAMVERYLLLSWTALVLIAGFGVARTTGLFNFSVAGRGRVVPTAVSATLVVWLIAGHVAYGRNRVEFTGPMSGMLAYAAPPTGSSWTPETFRSYVQQGDVVICSEELACLYLLDRIDYLLAVDAADVAHYAVIRRGDLRGFYANTAVLSTPEQLAAVAAAPHGGCSAVFLINSGKANFEAAQSALRRLERVGRVLAATDELFVVRFCRDQRGTTESQ